ncbi:MAG TPA: lamin tail domain-containing protein, partial [Methylomirabilota bacterium]|nr:lamin tail domain-containing protein [Methylomirabilota bacterium]
MALDDQLTPSARRWFFPPGSIIPAGGYRVVFADGGRPASPTNTGFGLSASGGSVFLFKKASDGGGLLDRIDYGLQTADYSIGRLPDGSGAWALTLPRAGTNNVAAPLGPASGLRVNEWMADPDSGDDWFEIYNTGDLPVALGGLFLSDDPGERDKFPIAPLSFIGSGANAYQVFIADDPATYRGPDHVNFGLSRNGDRILITAADAATQIDAVVFGSQRNGVSEGRLPDGGTNRVFFSLTASRGEANHLPLTNVVINEALTHTDLPLEDAIELHNPTDAPVDISGWWLSDDKDQLEKFRIPANTVIAAGGFKVFYEYQFNNGDLGTPFSLSSARGDEIYLAASGTDGSPNGLRTSVKFGPAANGVSFGRYRTSTGRIDFPAMSARSFGQDDPSSVEQFRTGTGAANPYPRVGPVVIRQIMYHPPDVVTPTATNDNVALEFIELRNLTAAPLPLYDPAHPTNGWRLRDAVDFVFNTTHSIPANGHLVVVSFDPRTNASALAAFQVAYGSNAVLAGPYSGKLDNSSDSIELLRPDPPQTVGPDAGLVPYILVDKVVYEDRLPWPTNRVDGGGYALRRLRDAEYGNDPINWVGAAPALGASGSNDGDGDGLPDDWEVLYGFNPSDPADADQDADGDGVNNGDEYRGGTDPRDAVDYLHVVSVDLDGEVPRIRFQAVAGRTYTLQYRDTLGPGEWRRATDIPAQGVSGVVEVTDPTAGEDVQR